MMTSVHRSKRRCNETKRFIVITTGVAETRSL